MAVAEVGASKEGKEAQLLLGATSKGEAAVATGSGCVAGVSNREEDPFEVANADPPTPPPKASSKLAKPFSEEVLVIVVGFGTELVGGEANGSPVPKSPNKLPESLDGSPEGITG